MEVDLSEFRKIPGFGRYLVHADGRVFSLYWKRVLKRQVFRTGYFYVAAQPDGAGNTNVPVHRLIALAFLGPKPFPDAVINHKDGNRENNTPTNLEWCSQAHNVQEAVKQGRSGGEQHGAAKLTEPVVQELRRLYSGGEFTHEELGRMFGISKSLSAQVCRRAVWKRVADISGKGGTCGS